MKNSNLDESEKTNEQVHKDENQITVDKIWMNIDAEFKEKASKENIIDIGKKTSHKAIRIFVSSTFTDFFNRREVLVKQVVVLSLLLRMKIFDYN